MRKLANLAELIDPSKDPDAIALIDRTSGGRGAPLTYSELQALIDAARTRLVKDFGIGKGDVCALVASNDVPFLASYFAVLSLGAVAALGNPRLSQRAFNHVVSDTNPKLVLKSGECKFDTPEPYADFDDLLTGCASGIAPATHAQRKDLALILYTSGSTGNPKGVMLSHGSQTASIEALGPLAELMASQRAVVAAPLFHMNALSFVHMMLAAHGSFVLLDGFETSSFWQAIMEDKVTMVGGVPTMLAKLAVYARDNALPPCEHVQFVTVGSAPLTDAVIAEAADLFPNATVINGYGSTEIGPGVFSTHPKGLPRPALSIGHPTPGNNVRLVDGPSDAEGVLEVSGPGLMLGYRNMRDETAARLVDGWFRTGDVMRRDKNGFFYFVGREDDMFVCNGENVYPGEIEKLIEGHPQVSQAAVIPMEDHVRGQIPIAFVVPETRHLSETDIKDFTLQNGPAFRHPRRVFMLDELPLTATNKVDRRALSRIAHATLG